MKSKFYLLAAASIALASCSSDETLETYQKSNENVEISFRPLMNAVTRAANAAGPKAAFESGDKINVYAGMQKCSV